MISNMMMNTSALWRQMRVSASWAVLLLVLCGPLSAQQFVQIEKYGSPHTEKLYAGDLIVYQLQGEEDFREGYIEGFLVEDSLIVLGNRYLPIADIAAFRFVRSWASASSASLLVLGTGWSGIAAIGFATDGDPKTSYRPVDAVVSGSAIGLGLGIRALFRYRTVKFGKRHRLRLLDLDL